MDRRLLGLLGLLAALSVSHAGLPLPPKAPKQGPGGLDYLWSSTETVHHDDRLNDALDYWLIEPRGWEGAGEAPEALPLVVFLHGWNGNTPYWYRHWLTHLARKGNRVVFPKYQNTLTWDQFFTPNAIAALRHALGRIPASPAESDDPRMIVIGHSYGGVVAANLANRAVLAGLPRPVALFLVQPWYAALDDPLSGLPDDLRLLCLVGDEDRVAGRWGCDRVWQRTGKLPDSHRNYLWMYSDARGRPMLRATHFAPNQSGALSHHGFWRLADALRDCTLLGRHCEVALGGGPAQRSLGQWSDGVPVREIRVTHAPPACPAGSGARGCRAR